MTERPLPGTSPEYDQIEKMTRTVIFDVVFDLVIDRVITAVPWLGYPVIKQVFMFIVKKLLEVIYTELEREVALLVIDAKVKAEVAAYEKAVEELKNQLKIIAEKKPSAEDMAKAETEFKNRLRDLIRIRPA